MSAQRNRKPRRMKSVGRIFLPEQLAARLGATMRRLGSDYPLAYCVRYALRLAQQNPDALRDISGPYSARLTTVSCEARQLKIAQRCAKRVFGATRGAYSSYVRAAIDVFIRYAESPRVEVLSGSIGSLSAAYLPQFWVSESMFASIEEYLVNNPEQNYGRFVRQAVRYALRYPARLPQTVEGPFVRLCYAATADSVLSVTVMTRVAKDPQPFMRRATALWLQTVA